MQTQDDGTYDILPVAALADHAEILVTLPRESDPKVRRDGRIPAPHRPSRGPKTIDERGHMHGAFHIAASTRPKSLTRVQIHHRRHRHGP